jgi:hypothetical protein
MLNGIYTLIGCRWAAGVTDPSCLGTLALTTMIGSKVHDPGKLVAEYLSPTKCGDASK